MVSVTTASAPLAHLHVRVDGVVTVEAIDSARALAAFDGFAPPLAAPCPVVLEVAPGAFPTLPAAGVLHYLLRRILDCPGADMRIVAEASVRERAYPAYLHRAFVQGALRLFESLEDALLAPRPGAPVQIHDAAAGASYTFA